MNDKFDQVYPLFTSESMLGSCNLWLFSTAHFNVVVTVVGIICLFALGIEAFAITSAKSKLQSTSVSCKSASVTLLIHFC